MPDLVWNKPFKAKIQEFYFDWLANGVHEYTADDVAWSFFYCFQSFDFSGLSRGDGGGGGGGGARESKRTENGPK